MIEVLYTLVASFRRKRKQFGLTEWGGGHLNRATNNDTPDIVGIPLICCNTVSLYLLSHGVIRLGDVRLFFFFFLLPRDYSSWVRILFRRFSFLLFIFFFRVVEISSTEELGATPEPL